MLTDFQTSDLPQVFCVEPKAFFKFHLRRINRLPLTPRMLLPEHNAGHSFLGCLIVLNWLFVQFWDTSRLREEVLCLSKFADGATWNEAADFAFLDLGHDLDRRRLCGLVMPGSDDVKRVNACDLVKSLIVVLHAFHYFKHLPFHFLRSVLIHYMLSWSAWLHKGVTLRIFKVVRGANAWTGNNVQRYLRSRRL